MIKEVIASGKDLNEARENARLALGAGELDDVTYTIIDRGSKGIFGIIGVKPVKVKATMEVADSQPRREVRRSDRRDGNRGGERRDRKPRENTGKGEGNKKHENAGNNNNKKNRSPRRDTTPKPAAVPENQLKFEHIDAAPGADRAFDFVNTLIADLGLVDVETELLRCEDGTRRVNIKGENASLLIGHHGDTLDALQYLANLATAQRDANGERDRSRVTIDVEGYRAKREATLRQLARRMAAKALARGSKVTLEPMTPYERRIIHSEVQSIEGVTTQSIGSDNNRRIVIYVERDKAAKAAADTAAANEEEMLDTAVVEEAVAEEAAVEATDAAATETEAADAVVETEESAPVTDEGND